MKQETDKLHEEYYKKFGRLHSGKDVLSPAIYDEISNNLLKEYKTEYKIMHMSDQTETERTIYEIETRNSSLIPRFFRRFIFWKRPNLAADQINRETSVKVNDFFNKREVALERLIASLEQSETDNQSRIDDIFNLILENLPAPRGKRAQRQFIDSISVLAEMLERRERLAAALEHSDENDNGEALKPTADNETVNGNDQSGQPQETPENGQNTDESASDGREHTEQTDEKTPADKPEETPTDGTADEPKPDNQTGEQAPEPKPRRRHKSKSDTAPDNEQMPGQMAIEMPPDTDDPGQTDE